MRLVKRVVIVLLVVVVDGVAAGAGGLVWIGGIGCLRVTTDTPTAVDPEVRLVGAIHGHAGREWMRLHREPLRQPEAIR